jgi:hypothetical protein
MEFPVINPPNGRSLLKSTRWKHEKFICRIYLMLSFFSYGADILNPHPLVVGKIVRNADVNNTFLAIAFEGQADGLDIPFQTGVVKLSCSPGCPEGGLLLPRIRVIGPDKSVRALPMPTGNIREIIGASIIQRISKPGAEKLKFSNGAILEIIAPLADPRILMYVEDVAQGSEVAILWDFWPKKF